ncbi:dihydroorotate dehydrogenase electron transfer subunit [Saliterribacillus persicus]|uniref:Dihydroorotate dehydrogenase B (NAD(+)), electron transfer subunit n=1 Tax=Saliterribacillus persicus TaxID=930114 RepID=A0A368XSC6_9BACI|nr:dihydroorotate dehydrogenase electron transfer subunit [Saliterribacillus persicus]RCW70775.1 dihydroorotate oxidase B electron transfer subunit [Saliterribacillus persicus]
MINKQALKVLSIKNIAYQTYEMVLKSDTELNLKPGQFIHIAVKGFMLRRPISIADVNEIDRSFTVIFKIFGDGTEALSNYHVGAEVDALMPLGTSYPIESLNIKQALLVGGGIGIPPLYYLGKKLKEKGVEVTSVLGYQSKEHVFYEDKFRELGETFVTTDDGSYGHSGFVTDVIRDSNLSFETYFSCGPTPMLQAVTSLLKDENGYISLEERMGCGVGTCYACVIPLKNNPNKSKKICKDGPVFDANEVLLG